MKIKKSIDELKTADEVKKYIDKIIEKVSNNDGEVISGVWGNVTSAFG